MASGDLAGHVAACPAHRYAVIDGGHFDDLPAMLDALKLLSAPLYLEGGDPAVVAAGAHVVELLTPADAAAVLALVGDRPAAVFWSWPSDLASLRRHLRTLNLVEIPNQRRGDPIDPAYETVLFRHGDPRVLASFLPAFTPAQLARLFGQSPRLVFDAGEDGGVLVATPPANVAPERGMLRFDPSQIEQLRIRQVQASRRRTIAFLRDTAPEHVGPLSDREVAGLVDRHEGEAATLGLTGERDVARWCWLQVVASGALIAEPAVQRLFADPDTRVTASQRLDALWTGIQQQMGG